MNISAQFDGGNIEVVDASNVNNIQLKIRKDNQSDFLQWFYFSVTGAKSQACCFHLTNASECTFNKGWDNYQAVCSYDRETWFRVPTYYKNGVLTIEHEPQYDRVYYAYFAPYSFERHQDLLAEAQLSPLCRLTELCKTVDGRDLSMLTIGEPTKEKQQYWIIARQHPGETMAEWFVEGFLHRLLDEHDPVSRKLLEKAVFHIVPNMNPDGSARGHLRTNAVGVNLNRVWHDPDKNTAPEVFYVREKMRETGVDFFFDVHGDEELPYNFLLSAEEIPDYSDRLKTLQAQFTQHLLLASPDFQTKHGYPFGTVRKDLMTLAVTHVVKYFDCLGFTLEMPFKDNADLPDPECGWSPERSMILGEAVFDALYAVSDQLRS